MSLVACQTGCQLVVRRSKQLHELHTIVRHMHEQRWQPLGDGRWGRVIGREGNERSVWRSHVGKRAAGGMSEDHDRCFSILVLGAFSTGVFNTNALPRINIGADVWGESSIMTDVC
jgi:hypothetical protein